MAKDPAFLFYPNDFIGGTMGMTLEEKGAYLELLILQFNKGSFTIAQAQRALGEKFENLWPHLHDKFHDDNLSFYNSRLKDEIEKRKSYSESRRKNREKKDMIDISSTYVKDSSKTGATGERTYVRHMENENENRDEIKNGNINRGAGEVLIGPSMVNIFKSKNPNYPVDNNLDYTACLQMAYKIGSSSGWTQNQVIGQYKSEVLEIWEQIIDFVLSDKWFSTRSISDLNKEWQRLIQSINNGTKPINSKSSGSKVTGEQLHEALNDFYSQK